MYFCFQYGPSMLPRFRARGSQTEPMQPQEDKTVTGWGRVKTRTLWICNIRSSFSTQRPLQFVICTLGDFIILLRAPIQTHEAKIGYILF